MVSRRKGDDLCRACHAVFHHRFCSWSSVFDRCVNPSFGVVRNAQWQEEWRLELRWFLGMNRVKKWSVESRNLGQMPQVRNHTKHPHKWEKWTKKEISILLDHPDMTAVELHKGYLPRHTPKAIQRMRERRGRYSAESKQLCCKCHTRPVWVESPAANRLGLCKGCYLDEEEQRLAEVKRDIRIRQCRSRYHRKSNDNS